MADIKRIVNASLSEEGRSVAEDNMNVVCIVTSTLGVLDSANRYKTYTTQKDVETDFGTTSEEAKFSSVVFQQSPNPIDRGGVLVLGYWRAVDENVSATSAKLRGEQKTEASTIPVTQQISDGSFDITIDGVEENITGLDLRVATDMDGIASAIDTALSGGTCVYENQSFVITSSTTGVTSTITYATDGAVGTSISSILGLDVNSSSVITQGADASVLSAETKVEAMTAIKGVVNIKGSTFIDSTTDQESKDLASWGESNEVLQYDVFSNPTNLEVSVSNPVWEIKLAGQTKYRMYYSSAGNRTLGAGVMATMHTVLFSGTNTAITTQLKEITGVVAEFYSEQDLDKAEIVGLDVYTTFKSTVPKLVTTGANGFTDDEYNILAYLDSVRTGLFNVLGTTPTKIPQTTPGLNQLLDAGEKISQRYVTAGVFAPGTWNSTERFGDVDTFNRNIEEKGFYWYSIPLSEQPQEEREERKTPVLQNAVKNSGAFHTADVIISWNK